jgi:L,D-transpeptidase YcbB
MREQSACPGYGLAVIAIMKRLGSFVIAACLVAGCSRVETTEFAPAIQRGVASTPDWVARTELGRRLWTTEQDFYRGRGHLPAWIDGDRPTPQLDALLQALSDADVNGLDPRKYGVDALRDARARAKRKLRRSAFEHAEIADLDMRLTYAFAAYAADLLGWSLSPKDVDRNWYATSAKADLGTILKAAIDQNRVTETIGELMPRHAQYRGLQAALKRVRERSPETNAGRGAKPQDGAAPSDERAGDWDVERIRMNMQRWRWLPRDLGERYVLVNVPGYDMQVIERDRPVLSMRVIVGEPDWPTPRFSDEMTYVVFSPAWNIPENILREETLPRLARDPEFLERNNMEVVGTSGSDVLDPEAIDWSDPEQVAGVRIRQRPGPDNALGSVKFVFPNHFNIYLHDTPTEKLFNRPTRALSHGCIRVENPVGLANYVLRDRPEWSGDRIQAAMNRRSEQAVTLKNRLPVHITYFTAWVEPDGTVKFLDDPYGLDRKQAIVRVR